MRSEINNCFSFMKLHCVFHETYAPSLKLDLLFSRSLRNVPFISIGSVVIILRVHVYVFYGVV